MKKGFTLVEVLIALALFIVMLSLVMPIFISNLKVLNNSDTSMSLREEAQKTIDAVTEKAMSAEFITNVKNPAGSDVTAISGSTDISTFNIVSFDKGSYTTYNFSLSNGVLNCKNENSGTSNEVSRYISSIHIIPVPSGTTYGDCKGIDITVNTSMDGLTENIQSTVYFRNHK